jgi:hypothetical protein
MSMRSSNPPLSGSLPFPPDLGCKVPAEGCQRHAVDLTIEDTWHRAARALAAAETDPAGWEHSSTRLLVWRRLRLLCEPHFDHIRQIGRLPGGSLETMG